MSIKDYIEQKKVETQRAVRREKRKKQAQEVTKVAVPSVLAAAAGAAAGVLLAPKSGKETRDDIVKAAQDTTEAVKAQVESTVDGVRLQTARVSEQAKSKYNAFVDRNMTEIAPVVDDLEEAADDQAEDLVESEEEKDQVEDASEEEAQ